MRRISSVFLGLAMVSLVASSSLAGAKLEIKDGAYIDLGFRVQHWSLFTQADTDGDGEWDNTINHRVRRGRLRVKGVVNDMVSAFIQTDVTGTGVGFDARVIDAFIDVKADPWFHVIVGENMAPSNRQNLTSSGALLALDRPGTCYKSLTWGGRAVYRFTNSTYGGTDSGLRGAVGVRDQGVTFFGSGPVGENATFKYYAGAYNGVSAVGDSDTERIAARGQVNFFDAEPGYYNSATYLGKKKTVGIGASVDMQPEVIAYTNEDGDTVEEDYMYFSFDGFAEYPVGENTLTVEAGAGILDLGDAAMTASGTAIYAQGGFLVQQKWQPWIMFEMFSSDHDDDVGSFSTIRLGLTHFLAGHNANIKGGVEIFSSDAPLTVDGDGNTLEDSVVSGIVSVNVTY